MLAESSVIIIMPVHMPHYGMINVVKDAVLKHPIVVTCNGIDICIYASINTVMLCAQCTDMVIQ